MITKEQIEDRIKASKRRAIEMPADEQYHLDSVEIYKLAQQARAMQPRPIEEAKKDGREAVEALKHHTSQIEQGYIAHGLPFTTFQEQASIKARATLAKIEAHLKENGNE